MERPPSWAVLAIVAAALAFSAPVALVGWNQGSHYAQIEALDGGSARIDSTRGLTGDISWYHGHFYSNKAPGLGLIALPVYATLHATGVTRAIEHRTSGTTRAAQITIWALGLWVVVLPAVILLLLMRWLAEQLEPGLGTLTALTLGLGTLLLPFSTMLFSHVLSACLGFGAFVLLWRERHRSAGKLGQVFLAGLAAGLAIAVEYPLGIVVVALGLYALVGRQAIWRRAGAYCLGAGLGVVPLLLYDQLAFGSMWHVSVADTVRRRGHTGHDVLAANTAGLFGVTVPSPHVLAELLFASRGLLTLAPVLAMCVVGLVPLYRRGWRAEAFTIAFVGAGFLLFNAGYYQPFAGAGPGPRLLIPALPFLALPLAAAYRRYPACTIALAAASVVVFATATATFPLLNAATGRWAVYAIHGEFQDSVALFVGVKHGWLVGLPFIIPLCLAIVFAVRATPRLTITAKDRIAALAALVVWVLLASSIPRLGHSPGSGAIALTVCAAAVGLLAIGLATVLSRGSTQPMQR